MPSWQQINPKTSNRPTHYVEDTPLRIVGIDNFHDSVTDKVLRTTRDREKKHLSELIEKLNEAFGKSITDTDKVAFAVHVEQVRCGCIES